MKKINLVDVIIFLAITAALVVGFFTYKHYRQTAGNQVETTAKIGFQIYLRGVTITGNENPIKPGDKTFITIRNVPYTDLVVLASNIETKKTVISNVNKTPAALVVDDYSQMYMYDIIVTVADMAKITKDGAVVGGNKIKIGLPITLEGQTYKLNGTVSDVRLLPEAPVKSPNQKQPAPVSVTPQGQAQAPANTNQAQTPAPAPTAQNQPTKQTPAAVKPEGK